jgi:hypothetical protein
MDSLADWLRENKFIINLKRGKTESLLFGTAQRIAKHSEPLKVSISRPSPTVITITEVYKYLGVLVDSSLNLNSNFDLCYKRGSWKIKTPGKIENLLGSGSSQYHLLFDDITNAYVLWHLTSSAHTDSNKQTFIFL